MALACGFMWRPPPVAYADAEARHGGASAPPQLQAGAGGRGATDADCTVSRHTGGSAATRPPHHGALCATDGGRGSGARQAERHRRALRARILNSAMPLPHGRLARRSTAAVVTAAVAMLIGHPHQFAPRHGDTTHRDAGPDEVRGRTGS